VILSPTLVVKGSHSGHFLLPPAWEHLSTQIWATFRMSLATFRGQNLATLMTDSETAIITCEISTSCVWTIGQNWLEKAHKIGSKRSRYFFKVRTWEKNYSWSFAR